MGTWGTGVFSNDTASDVRGEYRDLVANGATGVDATDRLLLDYGDAHDPDEADFWIGLAVAQSKVGRLEDRVRDRALELIDSGTDAARFTGADRGARQHVLERVRAELTGPQRKAMKLTPEPKSISPFDPRDLVAFETADGHRVLLVVTGEHHDKGGDYARVGVLDWNDSQRMPSGWRLWRHALAPDPWPKAIAAGPSRGLGFLLFASKAADRAAVASRATRIGGVASSATPMKARASSYVIPWPDLDDWFEGGRVRPGGPLSGSRPPGSA